MSPVPTPQATGLAHAAVATAGRWWTGLLGAPLRALVYVLVGLLLIAVLRRLITSVSDRLARGPSGLGSNGELVSVLARANPALAARRVQRAHTIGSVLRSTASLVVGTIVLFLVLDEIGVNLAPFIASAGVIGVAIGIGAQSLVRDFLTGLFMMAEDTYGVGDVIDAGPATGKVEAVGLRVTRIRDADGTLWFVPNGSMTRVGNKTQHWATAVVEVDVDYFADLAAVREVLLAAANDVVGDLEVGHDLRGDPSVTGIERLSADAVTMRVQVRTSASRQWEVARRLRVATRAHLLAAGIPLGGQRDLWDRHRKDDEPPAT